MKPEIIQLPKILDRRGNLSVVEQLKNVPFKIERAFWIYDVPGDSVRGGHAFRETEEFVVALSYLFVPVLSWFVFEEKISKTKAIAIGLIIGGVVVFFI